MSVLGLCSRGVVKSDYCRCRQPHLQCRGQVTTAEACGNPGKKKRRAIRFPTHRIPRNNKSIYFLSQWFMLFCYAMYQSASTAVTKYHPLDGMNNRILFLIVLEAGSPISRHCHGYFLVKALFLACKQLHSHCVFTSSIFLFLLFYLSICLPLYQCAILMFIV